MIFAAPAYIWLVIPVIVSYLLILRADRSRQNDVRRLADPQLQARWIAGESLDRRRVGPLLSLFGMLLLVVVLMCPQGRVIEDRQAIVGLDIIVALDVSRSMMADDLAPNRLAAAKKAVEQLLDHVAGDRVGLVAFAGSAFLLCPLTADYDISRLILADLGPDTIPKGGSSLVSALVEAHRAFRGTSPGGRILVLVSDGEDHTGQIGPALERLRRDGVAVIAAQVGTREGGLIPLSGGNFVKDRSGAVVKSRSNPEVLQMLASEVVSLKADGSGLKPLLDRARAKGRESVRLQRRQKRTECFQFPLAAALVLCSILLLTRRGGLP